ncbi:MAG TPA: BatA domain-containing protein [Verrucomicrobiae bacterium]
MLLRTEVRAPATASPDYGYYRRGGERRLAVIEFLNPVLFGGLFAVSAPIIIHLLHRRKIKQVDWGAMRFLLEMMAKRRRRLFLDELLLLLVRTLIIAAIAIAMLRPALNRRNVQAGASGLARQGRTAAVLLIDDSVSASAGRAQPAFESMKKLALAYLESLAPGDEVSVVQMSQLGATASDPIFDLEGVKSSVANLKPGYVATDIPALLDAGLSQLKRHINPGAELVLVTDGRKDGWRPDDKVRWDELRERLRGPNNAVPGTRQRPSVILLSPAGAGIDDNLAITSILMDRTLVSAGRPATARVVVANFGKQASRAATVQLSVNGQIVGTKQVSVPAGGELESAFPCTFPTPGSYGLEAALVNHQDLLPADDRRALSLQVESSVPVLLVDGQVSQGLETKLGFLEYALDPEREERGPFKVTRIPITQLRPSLLQENRVVVLGDARVLEPAMVDALERFVVGGGGVLVGLGPDTDRELVNRYWARNGEGFLPCPLANALTPPKPAIPTVISLVHPVFSGFGARNDEAWKAAKVRSYFKLDLKSVKSPDLDPLLKMDNDDVLVAERRRGLGLVTLVATSLNADWTELPVQAAFVPLMRGIVGRLGSFVTPPRNLQPGEQIIYARVKDPTRAMQGEDPAGKPLALAAGAWEGRDAIVSEPLLTPGIYTLHDPNEPGPIRCAVALAPAESALAPVTDREIAQAFDRQPGIFHSAEQVAANLDPARRQSAELWRWLLVGALGFIFLETLMTRREAAGSARGEPRLNPAINSRQ